MRRKWTEADIATIKAHYPDKPTKDVAAMLGCSVSAVYNQAFNLGIKKSQVFWDSDMTTRIKRGHQDQRMASTRFKPGNVPWNAGCKGWQSGGRSAETQFSTGMSPPNTMPVGSLRIVTSNTGVAQLERKINTQSGPSNLRWRTVHRLVWEAAHGPVPPGHIVVFKPGMKTLVEAEITLDKVDCISRAENARRNDASNKSPELKALYQLKGAITRQLKRIVKEERPAA